MLNLIRALAKPYPGAFTSLDHRRLVISKAAAADKQIGAAPGYILENGHVACGSGVLQLLHAEWADTPGTPASLSQLVGGTF